MLDPERVRRIVSSMTRQVTISNFYSLVLFLNYPLVKYISFFICSPTHALFPLRHVSSFFSQNMISQVSHTEVTVKCRIGADQRDSYPELCEFVHCVRAGGVRRLIVHARKCLLSGLSTAANRSVPPLHYEVKPLALYSPLQFFLICIFLKLINLVNK
jgi:hypothetical protein